MNFGWKPGNKLPTDLTFNTVANSFKAAAVNTSSDQYIIEEFTPISNQGSLSSCVANAVCDSLEVLLGHSGKVTQLSRLFVYWNARMYIKENDKDEGCYVRDAMDSLQTLGVCVEDMWQYEEHKVFAQPTMFAYGQANDNKINSFYRINDSKRLDQIEEAVRSNHPVVFGTAIPQTFVDYYKQDGIIWQPQSKNIGNHAMIVIGVRWIGSKREFLIRNSWGDSWGLKSHPGHCWMSEEYIAWEYSSDFWVPTLMELLV